MKNIIKFLVSAFVMISFVKITAQEESQVSNRPFAYTIEEIGAELFGITNSGRNSRVLYDFKATESTSIGSPFIMDFRLAKIDGYNHNYLVRYDAYNDEMQAKNSKDQVMTINKEKIKVVVFGNGSKYKVLSYRYDEKDVKGYLKVIHISSNITLLKKESITFLPAEKARSSYQPATQATFKRINDVYFILNDSDASISPIKKKKDFINLFKTKKEKLEKFIKSKKIKFSIEADLIILASYLSSVI